MTVTAQMGAMPKVITVIPVFNGEKFIAKTLESLAAQTRLPDVTIVIDDCSSDKTREIVSACFNQFPNLNGELRRNDRNQGLFGNLNRCLSYAARADVLHILLADDIVLPRFLEVLLPTLANDPAPAMAWSLTEKIDAEGRIVPGQSSAVSGSVRRWTSKAVLRKQGQLQTVFCGSILLKTGCQPAPCYFPMDYPQVGDCVFYADWARRSSCRVEICQVLCQIRHHAGSATMANSRHLETWVTDELRAMRQIAAWADVDPVTRWIWWQRISCLFVARSVVKQQMASVSDTRYAREIRCVTRRNVSTIHWCMGAIAVLVRDLIKSVCFRYKS